MNKKRIAIVGMGPIGSVLSAYLIRSGYDVTVIDVFREHIKRIRGDGLVIDGVSSFTTRVESAYLGVPDAALAGALFDVVFVCVKATAIRSFAHVLPKILNDGGVVISFQNGMDTEADIVEVLGKERTLRGVVNYAGVFTSVGRINMTFFNPPNYLGAVEPGIAAAEDRAREISTILTDADLACEYSDDIKWHVWEKVIRNAAMMPVSALTGMDMAQVMASGSGLDMVKKLLVESMDVSAADGYKFDQSFYDETLVYFDKAGTHVPSMLGDVQDGRRTEVEFLNGKVVEYGEKNGVDTPYSLAVSNLVLCIDELNTQRQRKSD